MAARKTTESDTPTTKKEVLQIKPPNFGRAKIRIIGTAPYVQAKFSSKAKTVMREKMIEGSRARKGKARESRDFEADFRGAQHISSEGWHGIPAPAFRQAFISACRLVGFRMTLAKLSLFVEADGFDAEDGTPLVRLHSDPVKIDGKKVTLPRPIERHVRNATGVVDLRVRPLWDNWWAEPTIKWDADMFNSSDIVNLLARVGAQVGIGEGRPDSKQSTGQGWGTFRVDLVGEMELVNV